MRAVPARSRTVSFGFRAVVSCTSLNSSDSVVTRVGSVVTRLGSVVARLGRLLVQVGGPIPVIGDPVALVAGLAGIFAT